jgi:Na+/H+ antiporter NhaD/arsenite permease-like protein
MIMQWAIAAVIAIAAVLQLAVERAPDIHDPPLKASARRIKIAALVIVSGYVGYAAWLGDAVQSVLGVGLALGSLAECLFAINRLFPELNNELSHRFYNSKAR